MQGDSDRLDRLADVLRGLPPDVNQEAIGTLALALFVVVSAFLPFLAVGSITATAAGTSTVYDDFDTWTLNSFTASGDDLIYSGTSNDYAAKDISAAQYDEVEARFKIEGDGDSDTDILLRSSDPNTVSSIYFGNNNRTLYVGGGGSATQIGTVPNDTYVTVRWHNFDWSANTYDIDVSGVGSANGVSFASSTNDVARFEVGGGSTGATKTYDYFSTNGADPYTNISGNVQNSGGTALESATVRALDSQDNVVASDNTDANGDYTLTGIEDGQTLTVNATKSGYDTASKDVTVSGATTENFVLEATDPTFQVNVTNEQGNTVGAATVVAYNTSSLNNVVKSTFTDGNGIATFELGTGNYSIVVRKQHHVTQQRYDVPVDVNSLKKIDMLLAREGQFEAGLYNKTVDPINGTLNGTNYSITEYDCAKESNLVDDGIQYLTGVFSPDPATEAPSCEAYRTSQEQIDAFSRAVATNRSEQYAFVFASNRLTDARSIAYTKGKIAAVEALNRGANKSVAREEAREAIGNYYSQVQKNIYARWTESAAQAVYIDDAMQEANEGDWIYVEGDGSEGIDDLETATVELVNGSSVAFKTVQEADGNLIVPIAQNASSSSGSVSEGEYVVAYAPNDTASTRFVHGPKYKDILGTLRNQDSQVKANVQTLVNNIYDEYSQDEINATDLIDPVEYAGEMSTDYNSTGYYSYAAAQLATLGYEGNVSSVQTIEVDYGNGNTTTYTGTLFYSGDDISQFVTGERYDPADVNGTFFMATSDGVLEINSPFVIKNMTDPTTGESITSVPLAQDDYATADATAWIDFLNQLDSAEEFTTDLSTSSVGGGGGLGDLFGDGSIPTVVIIGLVALLLLSLLGG